MRSHPIFESPHPAATSSASGFSPSPQNRLSPQACALLKKLSTAGLTPERLEAEWGAYLWSIRFKDKGRLRLKIELRDAKQEPALRAWLTDILRPPGGLDIRVSPRASCCHKPCEGCLIGNAACGWKT